MNIFSFLFPKVPKAIPETVSTSRKRLERQVSELEYDLAVSKRNELDLRTKLKQIEEEQEQRALNAPLAVDFVGMNAVSIERSFEPDRSCLAFTNIGYKTSEDRDVSEWYLYCSDEAHEQLVRQFKSKIFSPIPEDVSVEP